MIELIPRILGLGALCALAAVAGCKEKSTPNPKPVTAVNGPGATTGTTDDHADDDHDHDHADGDHDHDHDHGEEVSLGTATVGEMQVQCSQGHGLMEAGKESHLVVKLPHNDGGKSIVRAWIGTDDRLASKVGLGEYAADHDDYDIHAEAPDPLPEGAAWWIEVEKPDGTKHVGSIAYK